MSAFREEMEASWERAQALWDADLILGHAGAQFVKSHAIATSTHELVVATTLLAAMAPLANGATINLFGESDTPLNVVAVLVGYPQTRKSQMTKIVREISDALDGHIKGVAAAALGGEASQVARLELASAALSSFTPTVFFERCSGDYCHVRNADAFDKPELSKPLHMGRVANVDEVYAAFADFGLVGGDGKRKSAATGSQPINEFAGVLNRFLQFGECSRATKTSGSYGEGHVDPVSFALIGNMHPEVAVPMVRGEIGNHTGQVKERAWFYAAPRQQPHAAIPDGYVMPQDVPEWSWVDLDEELAEISDLKEVFGDPEAAAHAQLKRVRPDGTAAGDHALATDYLPDAEGYEFSLPDGVPSRLRYHMRLGVPVAELRVANREFALPLAHKIAPAALKVIERFKRPNRKLLRDEGAKQKLTSVTTLYNVKAAMASDRGNDADAATWGISPWKMGVIAGLLVPLDVFLGNPNTLGSDNRDEPILVSLNYFDRARKWLDVLNAVASPWRAPPVANSEGAPRGPLPAALQAALAPRYRGARDMAEFPATQPSKRRRAVGPLAAAVQPRAPLGGSMDSGIGSQDGATSAMPPPSGADVNDAMGDVGAGDIPDFDIPATAPENPEPKNVQDGVAMTYGYGPEGASAQISYEDGGDYFLPDRDIMQRTVLRGKPVVTVAEMSGLIRKKVGNKKPGVPKKVFEEVMEAGFAKYPLGKLLEKGTKNSRVVFCAPPTSGRDAITHYHNMLVDLCQVSLRQFTSLLARGN